MCGESGGWCKTHKMYGKKFITTSKEWRKKKDGTFAYMYKRKTNYTCIGARGMENQFTPSLVTLGASNARITGRIIGVDGQTDGRTSAGLVGRDYNAMSEIESESGQHSDGSGTRCMAK